MLFDLFFEPAQRHFIDNGRVGCQAHNGDVDLEVCAACPWLAGLDERAQVVTCSPKRPQVVE